VHHAVVDDGNALLIAGTELFLENLAQGTDVRAVDLLERAVALRIVGPAVHEPIFGRRIGQHVSGDASEFARRLGVDRDHGSEDDQNKDVGSPNHETVSRTAILGEKEWRCYGAVICSGTTTRPQCSTSSVPFPSTTG